MKFLMFHLNRIKYLILILLSIVLIPNAKALVSPTKDFYVNDYANILSKETEEYILNKSVQLNKVDGTQIVVVTVKNLEGITLEKYANQLFRKFGIGDKEKNNGLLLLLALEERKFRVEVGKGFEGILNDGKTGRFQDEYIIPYLKEDKWDEGVKNGFDAFYKEIVTLNNLDLEYNDPKELETFEFGFVFMLFLYVLPLIGFIIGRKIKTLKNNQKKYTKIYFCVWLITAIIMYLFWKLYFILILINLFSFIAGRFSNVVLSSSSGRWSSGGGGWSSGGGGFSGGGGSSSGGGSSRSF